MYETVSLQGLEENMVIKMTVKMSGVFKTKRTVHKPCTLVDKVVFRGSTG